MRKIVIGILIALAVVLVVRSCQKTREADASLKESSALIQQQMANVSKLVVTEGHYAEIFNYKDSKELLGSLITAQKRALVVVNAEATISYDLSQLTYKLDESSKKIEITYIPEAEIKLYPKLEYYDIEADYFNPFNAEDHGRIQDQVNDLILKKVKASKLVKNAENRLLSELSKLYILTHSEGWTLTYQGKAMDAAKDNLFFKD